LLNSLLTLGLRWPRSALASVVLALVVAGVLVVFGPLEVSTSRSGLVTSPEQSRLFDYYRAFGRSDFAALVVSGETSERRRQLVDRFEAEMARHPEFEGRVLGRVTLDRVAETLLVWQPELARLLPAATAGVEPGTDPWVSWARAAERRLASELDGASGGEGTGASAERDPKQLARLADLLAAFRHALATDGRIAIAELGVKSGGSSVDDHGYLVGGEGRHHLVLVFPALQSDEGRELKPLVERIRAARDRTLAGFSASGLRADLTGGPALAVDELGSLQKSSQVTSVLSTAGIFLLLMLAFRSFLHVVVLLLPLLAGMFITLGFVELVYDGLNLVTTSFMSVLLGLGIEFGVHLMHRYTEARAEGHDVLPALSAALLADGPAVALGACTTALAFLTTATTKFAAFSQLGVITAVGLGVTLVCTVLLFPALLPRVAGQRRTSLHEFVGFTTVLNLVGRRARGVLAVAALACALAAVSLIVAQPGFNGRTFDFLPASAESYRGLKSIEAAGTPPLDTHFVVRSLAEAHELTAKLRKTPEVSVVQSPSDLFPPETPERIDRVKAAVAAIGGASPTIPRAVASQGPARIAAFSALTDTLDEAAFALRSASRDAAGASRAAKELGELKRFLASQPDGGTAALNRVSEGLERSLERAVKAARRIAERGGYAPADLPPVFASRFVSKDGTRLALHAYPAGNVEEPGFGERFATRLRALDPNVAGTALNLLPHERYIIEGFSRAAGYSLVLITLILFLTFRRVVDTLLALLPVILGSLWMLALMRPLGIQFSPANMVALPLLLGISLDSGVHIVHRARESTGPVRLETLMQGTGTAVSVAALTNLIGFAALMAADYRAMQGMGLLLSLGIALSLVASVLVVPALLVAFGRARLGG